MRLKAELAIARGDIESENDGELPDYEKDRIKIAIEEYLGGKSSDEDLVFSDYRKIKFAFQLLKLSATGLTKSIQEGNGVLKSIGNESDTSYDQKGLSEKQVEQFESNF